MAACLEKPETQMFTSTVIDFTKSIECNQYDKGGIIDTRKLVELPNDFKNPFINDPIQYDKQINHVLIMYNPISGGGIAKSLVKEYIIPKFQSCKIQANVLVSEGPKFITKYLIQQKEKLLSLKIDAFIIVGGDGTYHEFINGYISGNWINENIPVLFACGGTGNSLSLNIGIDNEIKLKKLIDKFCKYIQIKKPIQIQYIDSIQINSITNTTHEENKKESNDDQDEDEDKDEDKDEENKEDKQMNDDKAIIYGCSQTYWGIPAATATTAESLRLFGGYRYDIAALYQIIRKDARHVKLTLYFDDTLTNKMEINVDISVLVVMKNKYFGKGLMITPLAKLDNGLLDIVILPNATRRHTLGLFSLVPKGTHILKTSAKDGPYYFRCKRVSLEPFDGCDAEIGIDGEDGPRTPFMIKAIPKAIPLIYFKE